MKKAGFLIFFLISAGLFAQSKSYLEALETFEYHFNNGDGQSIYEMWNVNMQSALNAETTKKVMNNLREVLGNLRSYDYIESNGNIEFYLFLFENGERKVSLALDTEGKISGLLFEEVVSSDSNPKYTMALQSFVKYFNENDLQAIHDMFSTAMKEQVDMETLKQFMGTIRDGLGKIDSTEYIETKGLTEVYLAQFENGKKNIAFSVNDKDQFAGLRIIAPETDHLVAKMERNVTPMQLPFKGTWFTVWGGDTKAQNYHVISGAQRRAFDFLILGKNNKTYERSGTRNEDYFAFGKPLYAACDATVIEVLTGVEDNKPGAMNPAQPLGNSVTLLTDKDEYIVYAHFRKGTIKVKEGDTVTKGQYLGECGNSGNSSEPHLHLHIQDGPKMITSVGVKCYFEEVMVKGELKTDYSPVRLDAISPPEE